MSTTTRSDALRALSHRGKAVLPAEVYLLDAHPCEADDENVPVAIIADLHGNRLNAAQPALAQAVENANAELGFDLLLVYHAGQPQSRLAVLAQEEGIRL